MVPLEENPSRFPTSSFTAMPGTKSPAVRNRAGFTLVELLVVMAIIGALVSVLLPAVQSARESARRIQCVNRMKQLGLAVLNYENTHRLLPPGGIVDLNPEPKITLGLFDPRAGKMFSWIVLILPFLEETALYDAFDFERDVLHQSSEPQQRQPATLLCPSDSADGLVFQHPTLTHSKIFAKANYAAFVSPYHVDLQIEIPGALGGNGQPMRRVRDGATHTLMLSEVRTRRHEHDQRGAWALPWAGASQLSVDIHHQNHNYQELDHAYRPSTAYQLAPQTPNCQGPNVDTLYHCDEASADLDLMPCGEWVSSGVESETPVTAWLSAAPRSLHTSGVNVVALDGRVGFMSDLVDPVAMAYLVGIEDGYVVESGEHIR